jgi:tRNA(Ile)-lysidine synthase
VALTERFARHVRERGFFEEGERVVIAYSGGLDSTVLAHFFRFRRALPQLQLILAHFDHRMHAGSAADARWVRGLAAAWELPAVIGEAEGPIRSEAEARTARYAFLAEVRSAKGARWVLTAHHADDQAETVLFRIFRGTGLGGVRGIPERGAGGVLRPLLPFTRAELRAYAEASRIPHRDDPTNRDPRYARNVIRHDILPRAESMVSPGARGSLLRLAAHARREEEAWRSLYPSMLEQVVTESREGRVAMARSALLGYHPGVRARLLREVVRTAGTVLDEAGTRAVLEFTSSGRSGRRVALPGGLILSREFDRLVLTSGVAPQTPEAIVLLGPEEGEGTLALNGRSWRVRWSRSQPAGGFWSQSFSTEVLSFPLRVRGWLAGDRITMNYGSKKLKKLFAEARVPAGERSRRPVLVDRAERVLWVPGVARSVDAPERGVGAVLTISVTESGTEESGAE